MARADVVDGAVLEACCDAHEDRHGALLHEIATCVDALRQGGDPVGSGDHVDGVVALAHALEAPAGADLHTSPLPSCGIPGGLELFQHRDV